MPAVGVPRKALFYMQDTGSTKMFYDLCLMRTNLFLAQVSSGARRTKTTVTLKCGSIRGKSTPSKSTM